MSRLEEDTPFGTGSSTRPKNELVRFASFALVTPLPANGFADAALGGGFGAAACFLNGLTVREERQC